MTRTAFVLTLTLLATSAYAMDQAGPQVQPPARSQSDSQSLSADQKARVATILSTYNAASLTARDAKAINEAFRAAGLKNGPALQAAIRDAGFTPERIGQLDPPADGPAVERRQGDRHGGGQRESDAGQPDRSQPPRGGGYSIEQAISDRAQLNTIAFDGLAFLTGDMPCNTFLPPGKVADFSGFQYMRDVDTNQLGHNTSFVPRAANNVLYVLTGVQKEQLVALAHEQEQALADFASRRFPLIKGFWRQLQGDLPPGSAGLSRDAVMKYAAGLYAIDGLLSYRRAEVLGGIVRSLTDAQKAYLGKMVFDNSATWPDLPDQIDRRNMSHAAHVAVMTYASEMFSWYAGSIESDVYFCPERHATYFGSFYMKDIPAMGNPDYSISTSLTGDSGEAFLVVLAPGQRALVTGLVGEQRADLAEIVKTRRAIATQLRRFMTGASVDRDAVMALSRRYGELDGEISFFYAQAFAAIGRTLSADQKQALLKLRNLDRTYACTRAYLYSDAIDVPVIPNTDFLFAAPGTGSAPPSEDSRRGGRPSAATRDGRRRPAAAR
jgi:hypothetical protein